MVLQVVNIRNIPDISLFYQFHNINGTESLDIHGVPADKIDNVAFPLRRTVRRSTADIRRIFFPYGLRAAYGTDIRYLKTYNPRRPLVFFHFFDLGNDLSGFVNRYNISDAHVQFINKILIVKSCSGHSSPAEPYRFKDCSRRDPSGTPY